MTFVRSRRSSIVHATYDARRTACGRKCDAWLVATDTAVDCDKCIRVAKDIEANGN